MEHNLESSKLPDREELIVLCEKAIVPQEKWEDRDSAYSQEQIGKAWAYLRAGCEFEHDGMNGECYSINMFIHGFGYFEGMSQNEESFYIPTLELLNKCNGNDWY